MLLVATEIMSLVIESVSKSNDIKETIIFLRNEIEKTRLMQERLEKELCRLEKKIGITNCGEKIYNMKNITKILLVESENINNVELLFIINDRADKIELSKKYTIKLLNSLHNSSYEEISLDINKFKPISIKNCLLKDGEWIVD